MRTFALRTSSTLLLLTLFAGCAVAEPGDAVEVGQTQSAILVNELPASAIQIGFVTWYRDRSALRTNAETASYCANAEILGYGGWRQPTQSEVDTLYFNRALIGAKYTDWQNQFGDYLVSGTMTPNGAYSRRMSDGSVFYNNGVGFNACVHDSLYDEGYPHLAPAPAFPTNIVRTGGLTWYRDRSALRTPQETATYCTTSRLVGRNGWRQPTQAEVNAFVANRAAIWNYEAWIGSYGDYLMSSTQVPGGWYGIRMSDASTFASIGVGFNPCVYDGDLYRPDGTYPSPFTLALVGDTRASRTIVLGWSAPPGAQVVVTMRCNAGTENVIASSGGGSFTQEAVPQAGVCDFRLRESSVTGTLYQALSVVR